MLLRCGTVRRVSRLRREASHFCEPSRLNRKAGVNVTSHIERDHRWLSSSEDSRKTTNPSREPSSLLIDRELILSALRELRKREAKNVNKRGGGE
jgi:hypothetical protein